MDITFADRSDDTSRGTKPLAVRSVLELDAPVGLVLCPDFISSEEEAALLQALDSLPWITDIKRRVQHFGFEFDYTTRSVNPAFGAVKPIPPLLSALFDRLRRAGMPEVPDQITVNEYVPGVGIKYHVDTHAAFADGIASLSLGSAVSFEMRRAGRHFGVALQPRSLLIMCGESRYAWVRTFSACSHMSVSLLMSL
jgi:alkylated DNA repair protein alkB family protein 8